MDKTRLLKSLRLPCELLYIVSFFYLFFTSRFIGALTLGLIAAFMFAYEKVGETKDG